MRLLIEFMMSWASLARPLQFSHSESIFKSLLVALAIFIAPQFSSNAHAASLNDMAGQMIMVGFQGDNVASHSVRDLRMMLKEGRVGGVMYLKFNVATLDDVRTMNEGFLGAGSALPPLIAIDQEGGSIERLTREVGFEEIQSAAEIARGQTPESAQRIYARIARELSFLGFNLNLGPVADVNINPDNPIIARYGRSFSNAPASVVRYAAAFVAAHRSANMLTALKHFPGHGSSAQDSHVGFVDITNTWQAVELEPFRELIAAGYADMVMVGHLFHQKFSTEPGVQLPSSLSPNWITGILRKHLGYNGVIISDDLEMAAVRDNFGVAETVVRAVRAGTDILLFSNTSNYHIGLADEIRAVIVAEARADPAFKALVEASYRRIRDLKSRIRSN